MIRKLIIFLSCFILSMLTVFNTVKALEISGVPVISETEIPKALGLSINKTYSEHTYLKQASANETGEYALLFLNYESEGDIKPFTHHYIQLFDSKGVFIHELSLFSTESLAIELTAECLYVYFCKMILVFNLENQSFSAYSTEDWAALESGIVSELNKTEFTSGQWTYKYKKSYIGYESLTRINEQEEQVLFNTDSQTRIFHNNVLPSVIKSIVVCLLAVLLIKAFKRTNQNDNTGHNTEDGSMC